MFENLFRNNLKIKSIIVAYSCSFKSTLLKRIPIKPTCFLPPTHYSFFYSVDSLSHSKTRKKVLLYISANIKKFKAVRVLLIFPFRFSITSFCLTVEQRSSFR